MGVCDLWSVAEPSQNKGKRARGLINRWFNSTIGGSIDRLMRGWEVLCLMGKGLSINAHQPTRPKNRPSHNQYQDPANLLPPPFGTLLSASPSADLQIYTRPPPHHTAITAFKSKKPNNVHLWTDLFRSTVLKSLDAEFGGDGDMGGGPLDWHRKGGGKSLVFLPTAIWQDEISTWLPAT